MSESTYVAEFNIPDPDKWLHYDENNLNCSVIVYEGNWGDNKEIESFEKIKLSKVNSKALKEESIIHCKDCKYFRTPEKYSYKEPNLYCCRSALTKVSENDFCSKAIRKEGEE